MNLKQIARKHETHGGALVWWLVPFKTIKTQSVLRQFEKIVPRSSWGIEENTFVIMEGVTVDVEFVGTLPPALERFQLYRNDQSAPLAVRYQAFGFIVDQSIIDGFWEAYTATRDTVIEAQAQSDPES